MNDLYEKINWTNETPLSVENLNKMDAGIKALDEGITELESDINTKIAEVNTRIEGIESELDYAVLSNTNSDMFNII